MAWDLKRRIHVEYPPGENMFHKNNIYITVQPDEDIPYLLKEIGADNLLSGSDYGHVDPSTEMAHVQALGDRAERGDFSADIVRKIVYDNPKAFYGL